MPTGKASKGKQDPVGGAWYGANAVEQRQEKHGLGRKKESRRQGPAWEDGVWRERKTADRESWGRKLYNGARQKAAWGCVGELRWWCYQCCDKEVHVRTAADGGWRRYLENMAVTTRMGSFGAAGGLLGCQDDSEAVVGRALGRAAACSGCTILYVNLLVECL